MSRLQYFLTEESTGVFDQPTFRMEIRMPSSAAAMGNKQEGKCEHMLCAIMCKVGSS